VAKEQWIKTSFWMPENAEEELKTGVLPAEYVAPEKPRMTCPYISATDTTQSHRLKFKDLITLKLM